MMAPFLTLTVRLIQFISQNGQRRLGQVSGDVIVLIDRVSTTYELLQESILKRQSMEETAAEFLSDERQSYEEILMEKRILVPIDHPDPYHTWVTGTGLTHKGSAASRNTMHEEKSNKNSQPTDSMKMFQLGVERGKKEGTTPGVQPEWFFKGNGLCLVNPGQALRVPDFGLDGGEEPEVAGLYIIDKAGKPQRVGFSLGNEFSDHKMERINYLYLAHSKLRTCSIGPELLLGELPSTVAGKSRIIRNGKVFWEKDFLTGEDHMTHNLANLEHHHFKYELFRQPGDLHVHFLGTSVLSFADQVEPKAGDVFEIESAAFGKPLKNPLQIG